MADIGSIKEKYSLLDDAVAREEEAKEFKLRSKHNRHHQNVDHYGRLAFKISILVIVVALLLCRAVWLVLPGGFQWITKEQLSEPDKFVVEGGIGAFVYPAFKSIIPGKRDVDFG